MPAARRLRLAATALGAVAAVGLTAALGPTAADAAGSFVPSEHVISKGWVSHVGDGDTPTVSGAYVRLIGVQATEVSHGGSRQWCHSISARDALNRLVDHHTVQLRADYASSTDRGRPLRSVYVQRNGAWRNVQRDLINKSQVMWFSMGTENTHNYDYHVATAKAMTTGRGLWNTSACGTGPAQAADLRLYVHWDGKGPDHTFNDAWVRVVNKGTQPVHIGGWHIRDATHLDIYTFPGRTVVQPYGGSVILHGGQGSNPDSATAHVFHWNKDYEMFKMVRRDSGTGDIVILMDNDGDFRSWTDYPCVYQCGDPALGHLAMTVHNDADREWVTLQSINTYKRLYLGYYQFRANRRTYVLPRKTYLDPGETLVIHAGSGKNSRLEQYAGMPRYAWPDNAGEIDLSTLTDIQIVCKSWGSGTCNYNY